MIREVFRRRSKAMIFIHETAVVDPKAHIGEGTMVWHFCHVDNEAIIGKNCVLGQNCYVAPGVVIGDNVRIQNNVSLYTGVKVEDDVFIGPSAVFTNVTYPKCGIVQRGNFQPTLLRRGCTIGANSTIIAPCIVGERAVIGAGAVLTGDAHKELVFVGSPAKAIRGVIMYARVKHLIHGQMFDFLPESIVIVQRMVELPFWFSVRDIENEIRQISRVKEENFEIITYQEASEYYPNKKLRVF